MKYFPILYHILRKRILRPILLAGFILAFYVISFCFLHEEFITKQLTQSLEELTGYTWRIKGPLYPTFYPIVGLAIPGVHIEKPTDKNSFAESHSSIIQVKKVDIQFSIWALLQGKLMPRLLHFEEPTVFIQEIPLAHRTDPQLTAQTSQTAAFSAKEKDPSINAATAPPTNDDSKTIPTTIGNSNQALQPTPDTIDTSATTAEIQKTLAKITDFLESQTKYSLPGIRITEGKFFFSNSEGNLLLSCTSVNSLVLPWKKMSFTTALSMPNTGLQANITVEAKRAKSVNHFLEGAASINLIWMAHKKFPIDANVTLPFQWEKKSHNITCNTIQVTAEGDSLTLDVIISPTQQLLTGHVSVQQLSLPRWFKFGRNLPPGLQNVVHTISGSFDVVLTPTGIWGDNLKLNAGHTPVSGTIAATNFLEPVIEVDIALANADVDQLLPFLATSDNPVITPEEPSFTHPFLVPYIDEEADTSGAEDDLIDVGYHVRILAEQTTVHSISGGSVEVLITPRENDVCRVAFSGSDFASGKISGYLDIDVDQVDMHLISDKVDISQLPENKGNSYEFGGYISIVFDIKVPVKNTFWDPVWKFSTNGTLEKGELSGGKNDTAWYVYSESTAINASGDIHAVRTKGIRLDGLWNFTLGGIASSWYAQGTEKQIIRLQGGVSWPRYNDDGSLAPGFSTKGIDTIYGQIHSTGSMTVPLGSQLVPVTGKTQADLLWKFSEENISFTNLVFDGLKSKVKSNLTITFPKNDILIAGGLDFSLSLPTILKHWDLTPNEIIHLPEHVFGTGSLKATANTVGFHSLALQVDGTPLKAEAICHIKPALPPAKAKNKTDLAKPDISFDYTTLGSTARQNLSLTDRNNSSMATKPTSLDLSLSENSPARSKNKTNKSKAEARISAQKRFTKVQNNDAFWNFTIQGEMFNFDTILPPRTPEESKLPLSKKNWDLTFLKDFNFEADIALDLMQFQRIKSRDTHIQAKLVHDQLSLIWKSNDFYQGKGRCALEGEIIFPSNIMVHELQGHLTHFTLLPMLKDFLDSDSYDGTATLDFSLKGLVGCAADFPGNLSGLWSVNIEKGMYPAFIGGESAGLRNTFDTASVAGEMQKGVLHWENFTLEGIAVDISAQGQADLVNRQLDITASITFARVPTVPVRISGSFDDPSMYVRGAHMVLHTAQAAGTTIFDVVSGILSLPARAIRGISDLFSSEPETAQPKP